MRRLTAAVGSALFFLLAPGVVVGLIPWLLTRWQAHESLPYYWGPVRVIGMILLLAGLIVLVGAFARFVMEGFGTPAPVAAPERLVVGGVYGYVHNPMYVAILAAIVGQALILGRLVLLVYATVLLLISAAFVRFYEEPALARRFGADWPTGAPCPPGGPACVPGSPASAASQGRADAPADTLKHRRRHWSGYLRDSRASRMAFEHLTLSQSARGRGRVRSASRPK